MTHHPDTLIRQGAPCLRGHPGKRYVSSGRCVDCTSEDAAVARRAHQARQVEARARLKRLGAASG